MTTKKYAHGTAFEESFRVTLRGEVSARAVGWGSSEHEKKFLEEELHHAVRDTIERFYQCKLFGASLEVEI